MAKQLKVETDIKRERMAVLKNSMAFDEARYEYSDKFVPSDKLDPYSVHTIPELMALLEKDNTIEVEARVLFADRIKESLRLKKFNREGLLETWKKNSKRRTLKESVDTFLLDDFDSVGRNTGLIGDDYIPLLGGPFNKQLYYYDYLRMHALAFFAYHHDPIARSIITMTRDFVLGRGFEVKCKNDQFQALWNAFAQVNDLDRHIDDVCIELALYGETMTWWLPNKQTKIQYQLRPGQEAPTGLIPRIRLIDPSVIWEVVTFPEDITRVLYYQWVAPTQYQIYAGNSNGQTVSTTKFIFQQVPANQVQHHKINCVSNEKRGRSDLFPILGYLKRLRDTINYSVVALQKNAAWSMDTSIEGNQTDIDNYISDQQSLGAIAPAGSEFVHTSKIKREYLSNASGQAHASPAFEWCLSMIAAGSGIPINYFGTHISGGQTRASAIVATEPVAKKWQHRQMTLEKIIRGYADKLGDYFGIAQKDRDLDVIFPEIIIQDRSATLKDLALCETEQWFSKELCATIAAKEFSQDEFDYTVEKKKILADPPPAMGNPLSAPGGEPNKDTAALPGDERNGIKLSR